MNIYSSLNRMEVHNVKNALEAAGIECELRGEFRRAAMGEIPISESYVEVWLVDPAQEKRARQILVGAVEGDVPSWLCPRCNESVGGVFARCWNCQAERPEESSDEDSR